jgi:hypothetical protein
MNRRLSPLGACLMPLLLAACASTTFTSTWKAPDAQPLQFRAGDKIVAMVVAKRESIRLAAEASVADVLDEAGLQGVPAYTLAGGVDLRDEEAVKRVIDASGAAGAVVLRPLGRDKEVSVTPTASYAAPRYGRFWGGYYGYGWGSPWGAYEVRTDTYVYVETLLYDLRQNKLVWAGESKTINPTDVDSFVADLAKAVSAELRKAGLVAGK